jgi:serine/threonine protein kinase
VDYYSLGVILHEVMFGRVPLYRDNEKDLMQVFFDPQYEITKHTSWSHEAVEFVNGLLKFKPANRLGAKGSQQLREHEWFKKYGQIDQFDENTLRLQIKNVTAKPVPVANEN